MTAHPAFRSCSASCTGCGPRPCSHELQQYWGAGQHSDSTPWVQVLLSQVHRLRALTLLGRFLDMGSWAVDLALSVGIFPYVLKLLQTTATDLRQTLVFIWTKILALDRTCQVGLQRGGAGRLSSCGCWCWCCLAYFCSMTGSTLRHRPPQQGLLPTTFAAVLSPPPACSAPSTYDCSAMVGMILLGDSKRCAGHACVFCVSLYVCDLVLCKLALMKDGAFPHCLNGALNCAAIRALCGLHADLKKDSGLL